ncbi:MAG: ArsR/SmtB family transcription factor [Cyclobacteriaceae bacterium]
MKVKEIKALTISLGCDLFKAFGEEARVRILFLIYKNDEMCIADLEQVLDFTQTKVSRHIKYLKSAGILNVEQIDQWRYYSIEGGLNGIITTLFNYLENDSLLVNDLKNFRIQYANNELAIRKLHNKKRIYTLPEL